jgi:GNAT superfamily N-acetyltransferase
MTINWKLRRLDEGEAAPRPDDCLLEVTGAVVVEGEQAGWLQGFYLDADDLASQKSFWELWDIDARTCELFERILDEKWHRLREPLETLLVTGSGLLCIEELALFPEFRGKGLGEQVMQKTVGDCAHPRVRAVLLQSEPMQYTAEFVQSVRRERLAVKLPDDDRERDRVKLQHHFRSWGMQLLPRTTYMAADPDILNPVRIAANWPPCVIQDLSNTCVFCNGLIDYKHEEWERTSEGLAHKRCPGEKEADSPSMN